jgi:hypothetical protein
MPNVTVTDAALTPTSTAVSATEGVSFSGQVATFTDANPTAPLTDFTTAPGGASINWGDGSLATTGTVTQPGGIGKAFVVNGSHTYAEEGSFTITVSITDVGTSTAMAVPTGPNATVADAALTASGTAVSATEGLSFSGKQVASFTDANLMAPLSDFTATINWGDSPTTTTGTVTQPGGTGTAFEVSGDHTYAEEGSFMITVSITDKGGSMASPSSTATVADAALTATGGFIVKSASIGNHTVATFTDANQMAPLTDFTTGTGGATINWGDGTSSPGTITQPGGVGTTFQVQGNHTYTDVLTYQFPISVSIMDKGGSTASAMSTATAFFVVTGFPSPVAAGTSGSFTVTAIDINGNKATGYIGTAMLSTTSAKATLPVNSYMFKPTDMGVHMFTGAILKTAGSQSITATDSVISTFTGAQTGIIINPIAPHHFAIALFPFKPTAGVAGMFRVTIQDLYSNTVNIAPYFTDTVHFTSTDPKAVLPPDFTFSAPNTGVQDFMATLFTAGTQGITVSDVTNPMIIPASQADILLQPAAMTQLGVSGFPPFVTTGAAHSVTVTAQDTFGNTIPDYLGTVHFTSSDGAAMLPADYMFTSSDAGQHTFTMMATLNTVGSQSITSTDTMRSPFTGTQSGIAVQPIQPMAGVSGPTIGVPGQPLTYTFSASETGLPATTVYTFNVMWGDGSSQSFSGTTGTQMSHTYVAPASITINATAIDPSGNTSLAVSTSTSITVVAMEPDPTGSGTALYVGGTTGNDNIAITPSTSASNGVKVGVNSVSYGEFFQIAHVIVYGQTGTDIIKTAAQTIGSVLTYVNVPLIIFAGNGNNALNVSGSMAGNVLVGGGGSNKLYGGQGRDILIAGAGPSTLTAGSNPMVPDKGGAILIGGTTNYDNNAAALASILAEWSSNNDYPTRMAHLMGPMGGLNGTNFLNNMTVHDNHMIDTLIGGSGMDWYFAGMADVIKNQTSGEMVTPIT